jgi:hypothetical protein
VVYAKNAAESVLYSEIICYLFSTEGLRKMAQLLRDATLEGRDLAGYISRLSIGNVTEEPLPLSRANAFSDILTEARHLRCLDVSYPDLSLLAVIIACRTHTGCMESLTVDISESTFMSILSHIGHFTHLRYLLLRFEKYGRGTTELTDVTCVPWNFLRLRSLSILFGSTTLAPLARLLCKSKFPVLEEKGFTMPWLIPKPDLVGEQELAQFVSRLSLRSLKIYFEPAAEGVLIAILPHIRTSRLQTWDLNTTVVSLLPRAVTVLHSENMGIAWDKSTEEEVWAGLDLLRHGETGVQEFTTNEWWGTNSWVAFLELEGLDERKERAQMRRTRYAALLGAKGIRFTDPQGKTMAEYMDGAR